MRGGIPRGFYNRYCVTSNGVQGPFCLDKVSFLFALILCPHLSTQLLFYLRRHSWKRDHQMQRMGINDLRWQWMASPATFQNLRL